MLSIVGTGILTRCTDILGPILFVLYTMPLSDIIANHSVNHQLFTDDTQLQKSAPLNEVTNFTKELNACTDNIKTWMMENQLKLNDDKTEALLFPFSSSLKPSTSPLPDSITLGSHNIPFSDSAMNLGFILDSKLSMKKHIIKMCQTAYFELKRISSIRRFLTEDAAKTLVTSYILSRPDYCYCLLMGTCKTHGFRTFSCFGPHIWNSLPQDLRHCATLSSFKAKLKTFLFSQYFHPN